MLNMAYPFPSFSKAPQTLLDSPRDGLTPRSSKRTTVAVFLAVVLFMWMISPFSSSSKQTDKVPFSHDTVEDYFAHFEGHQDCGITSTDIYIPPTLPEANGQRHTFYCSNRAKLLDAMTGGGRHGFEAPFSPATCHYRWYSTPEICMILERFDTIVFIGDDMLKHIYAAFNMLLREDIAMGGLKQWELTESERITCRCDNQIVRPECSAHAILESKDVTENDQGSRRKSPYYCDRVPHVFLPIADSPAPDSLHSKFGSLLAKNSDSYKPVTVIHSLGLATSLSLPAATSSMDEWVALADMTGRNVPFLWLGPNAAGHVKPPGQIMSQGNNAIWHYTIETGKESKSRELDALGMYNLTLQATSWDGNSYGQKVGLVQAMMIINWLSRVDST